MIDEFGNVSNERLKEIREITPKIAIKDAIENKLIQRSIRIIGTGKEAFVIWAKDDSNKFVALKSFRIFRSTHRYQINNTTGISPFSIISNYAKREYWKVAALSKLGLPTPKPYKHFAYSFTMEFLGNENGPYPLLSQCTKSSIEEPVDILEKCIGVLQAMFKHRFVHGDFNAQNLMYNGEKIFVIDFLQTQRFALKDAVHNDSPLIPLSEAYKILKLDLNAILSYFQVKFRIQVNYEEVLNYCISEYKEKINQVNELNNELKKCKSG